jgi:YD repeat-containing protein
VEATKDRVTWTYDSIYQLTQEQRSGVDGYQTTYVYDANGNRLETNADGSITTSTFDGADQLIDSVDSTGTTSYSYDADGNLSLAVSPTGERTTRTWGYENQVELVQLPDGKLVTALYNADNRRVQKLT